MNQVMEMMKFKEVKREVCLTHGEYDSTHIMGKIWSGCKQCAEENRAAHDLAEEDRKGRARRDAWLQRLNGSEIPVRFRDRSLSSFMPETDAQRKAHAFATAFAEGFADVLNSGRSAIFCGRPGTGKTHLAVGIGLMLMEEQRRTVLFSTVFRALRRVKDTWRQGSSESETQAIDAIASPDLLILDEVGVQFGSETEKLILFDILNERYENRLPTLILSNLDLDGIRSYLGERIFDRLREDGGEAIVFDWASHRGQA